MTAPVLVVSGPSGVGKSSVVRRLLALHPNARLSVSVTTRQPRSGEVDGVDYTFVTDADFDNLIAEDHLLEWAEYAGHRYGTPRREVQRLRDAGHPVVMEIEVQGAGQVRTALPDAHLVFLEPPSMEILRERLVGRGTENPDALGRRLAIAEREMAEASWFDTRVVNADVEACAGTLVSLLAPEESHHS
jgi:guanylate kinase